MAATAGPGGVKVVCSVHSLTLIDWLAVASRVPSSAHRWASPWPKPLARACMWMSQSTHVVGTSPTTRRVLSRLRPMVRTPRGWETPPET